MDDFVVQALVRAGTCRRHASTFSFESPFYTLHHKTRRRGDGRSVETARGFRTKPLGQGSAQATATVWEKWQEPSQEELKGLVDTYDFEREKQKAEREFHQNEEEPWPEGPLLLQYPHDEKKKHYDGLPQGAGAAEFETVRQIEELLTDEESSHEQIYAIYQTLPFPRVSYLSEPTIRKLTHHLSVVERFRKDEKVMMRFLSIIDDMKAANIPATAAEWTSAMHFAGRCVKRVSEVEVENALYIWRQMEAEAGVTSTNVTFNAMFDIAAKAGKFVLADVLLKEMQRRNLRMNRHFRTGMIFYYGLKGDGEGVRRAYKELVESGEVVDTIVLNCVISSLIKAGEPHAAEQVFGRMKNLHRAKTGRQAPPTYWREQRQLTRVLNRASTQLQFDVKAKKDVQDLSPVAPNAQTFRSLINYHAIQVGDLSRVTDFLKEMQDWKIPISAPFYYLIFNAFWKYGGVRYSGWTRMRLEGFWESFLEAQEKDPVSYVYTKPLVITAIRAFGATAGKDRALQVWERIREHWVARPDEMDHVQQHIFRVMRAHDGPPSWSVKA
ncbi:hypothetical protein LTS18_000081 [Coniosporium uncinatum]|uniref:Uncharacterized protein n=1 Tax=Coniosporium uncinatum TaxID=93489 RepID=A0ACC3DDE5_9PEZI|nr:hypothetical protein LTS18_000081 [Coniosporium uncinatum]